jgi:hypothetical protein
VPADQAWGLARRFTFHCTPKSASWLKMIEIEFSALARQCLHRRIPTLEQLEREVLTLIQERDDKRITLRWQCSIEAVRAMPNSKYQWVHAENEKFKITRNLIYKILISPFTITASLPHRSGG